MPSFRRSAYAAPATLRRLGGGVGLAALALTLVTAAPAASAEREEYPIASASLQTDVRSSLVTLHVPLPASTPKPYPAACDWLQYLRFRHADGPAQSTDADAVAVLMPGVIEGATAFDIIARNTIREQARRGRHIEVWGIDRRSACLEDLTGMDEIERSGDFRAASNYYYRGGTINGRKFGGFKVSRVLAEFGLRQTISDYYDVIVGELPDQAWRERRVICGGHSLGGPLTEFFAAYDRDRDPATTHDAGYRQCAGYMGFDTALASGSSLVNLRRDRNFQKLTGGLTRLISDASIRSLRAGTVPGYVDIGGIGPETMALLDAVGAFAHRDPDADLTPILAEVPDTPTIKQFFHLQGSRDLGRYLFSNDSLRQQRYSAMAMLGQVMDDNAAVISLVRTSIGFFEGPVIRNHFANGVNGIPGLSTLLGKGSLFLPRPDASKPLIRWRNYDDLPAGGSTRPADEITDARDFARIQFEGPTNMTEAYFPIRLMLDLSLFSAGSRSAGLDQFPHGRGIYQSPRFTVIAGDGVRIGPSPDPHVVLPGYQHLDVVTAAEVQNNGKPEGSSQAFANLIDRALAKD